MVFKRVRCKTKTASPGAGVFRGARGRREVLEVAWHAVCKHARAPLEEVHFVCFSDVEAELMRGPSQPPTRPRPHRVSRSCAAGAHA